jgi:hypothetical protein
VSDKNLYNYYEDSSDKHITLETLGRPSLSPDWSDTVKITSGCSRMFLEAEAIYGGAEDACDTNNHATSCTVHANWHPQGKYLATIKGGSHSIALMGDVFSHGSEVDVDLGNWSDQSQDATTATILGLWSHTGKPIRVRVLNATVPTLMAGSGPYVFVWPRPDTWYHGIAVKIQQFLCKRGWL